jgi:hypothetical protein
LPIQVAKLGITTRLLGAFARFHVRLQGVTHFLQATAYGTLLIGWPALENSSAIVPVDLLVHLRGLIGSPAVVSSTIILRRRGNSGRLAPLSYARRPVGARDLLPSAVSCQCVIRSVLG